MSEKPGNGPTGTTYTLAEFVRNLSYDDLPPAVREFSKNRLLDSLAAAFGGHHLPHCRTAINIAGQYPGDITVWGEKSKAALSQAVTANSVMAHSLLLEDGGGGHPSTIIPPLVLGVAEETKASGQDALLAIAIGYELSVRLAGALGHHLPVAAFRPASVVGPLGAAAAAGKLMQLDTAKLASALGYAVTLTPGSPAEGWLGGQMEPMFEAGWCSRLGIEAAILAAGGATVSPHVLEGPFGFLKCWAGKTDGLPALTTNLGQDYYMLTAIEIKLYPACGGNQLTIHAALPLARHGLKATEIARVINRCWPGVGDFASQDFTGPFTSQFQAQMSLPFCTAATILGRPVASIECYAEHYDDPEVYALAQKVTQVFEWGRTKNRIEVYCHDGRVLTAEAAEVDTALQRPTLAKMEQKMLALAAPSLGEERVREIIAAVKNLEGLKDIRELTALL